MVVVIDIQKPTPKLSFSKPAILGFSSGEEYATFVDIDSVREVYDEETEEYKAAKAMFLQGDDAPVEIAIIQPKNVETLAGTLSRAFKKDWYFLVSVKNDIQTIVEIADSIEMNNSRIFFTRLNTLSDLASLKQKEYSRTVAFYHEDVSNYPEAAWIGRAGSADAGSLTWKFKTLMGIMPMEIDNVETIHDLGANTYLLKAGDRVTSEGKVVNGEYIDIIHSKDDVTFSIEYAVQKLLNKTKKISFDAGGIPLIESEVKIVLQRKCKQGMIAKDTDGIGQYGTHFMDRNEVDPADRAERLYNGGEFWFELAGAIHGTKIKGLMKI